MSNYYLIGTKYGDPNNQDIVPYCLQKNVIAIGFAWDTDLTEYYNKDQNGLEILLRNEGETPATIAQMKKFLQLQPGDIIALKGTGAPIGNTARLDIVGYAVVMERNGIVYQHDKDEFPRGLGHTINVEFLEIGIKRTLELGYGQSIHHIILPDRLTKIFGLYSEVIERVKHLNEITQKNIEERVVEVSAKYLRTAIHNKIQQIFYEKLSLDFGIENVEIEENFVDLVLKLKDKAILIEVKPYNSARQCIVEGIGQLLNYFERSDYDKNNLELMIVGNKEASIDDVGFINFIKATLQIPFTYQGFEEPFTKIWLRKER